MNKPLNRKRQWVPEIGIWSIAAILMGLFVWILGDILWHGAAQLSWSFLVSEPMNAGREGGILPILVSTGLILLVCLGVAFPLGLGTAVLLTEFGQQLPRFRSVVELSLDILAGVPSIVFGLFGNAFFTKTLGFGLSILSGGLTLACMVLPILIRSLQQSLVSLPPDYRRSAAALGISKTATFKTLLLPAAMPGLVVGLLLGFGRAIAETAALIFTSGYVDRMPTSVWDSGRSLSIHIFDLAMNVGGGEPNAYATACVLILILIVTNILVTGSGYYFKHSRLQVTK